jgi:hypothetical protein
VGFGGIFVEIHGGVFAVNLNVELNEIVSCGSFWGISEV